MVLARDENIMGGSVVRDAMGRFIVAYTIFFGEGTNNRAEFQALAEGLRVVHALSLDTILIKGDSSLVISAMKQQNTNQTLGLDICAKTMPTATGSRRSVSTRVLSK